MVGAEESIELCKPPRFSSSYTFSVLCLTVARSAVDGGGAEADEFNQTNYRIRENGSGIYETQSR